MELRKARAHLQRQVDFLERSATAFDDGYVEEAVRIAVVLRVLLHDTSRSTSVLTHLGVKDTLRLLSTCPDWRSCAPGLPPDADHSAYEMRFQGLVMTRALPGAGATVVPGLGAKGRYGEIQCDLWWKQLVWASGPTIRITRGDIILAAANKDGGAHVDVALTPQYEALASEGFAGAYTVRSGDVVRHGTIDDAHLVSLRQMAYEVLQSPEFMALYSPTIASSGPA